MWSMGSACANTTLQDLTASTVPRSTMTALGRLLMAKLEPPESVSRASVMGMPTPVTLTWMRGWHQATAVVVSATTVSTTQRGSTANAASQASTETCESPSLPQMLANPAPATLWDRPRSPWAPAPSATPAPVTAPASLAWRGRAVTAACPDTGASAPAAAGPATAPGAATLSLAIATAAAVWMQAGSKKCCPSNQHSTRASLPGAGRMSRASQLCGTPVNASVRSKFWATPRSSVG